MSAILTGGLRGPRRIHGATCSWYIHAEDGEEPGGVPPKMQGLFNLAANRGNGSITQAAVQLQPHRTHVGGKVYAKVNTDVGNNVYWDNTAIATPLWAAGETHVKLCVVASFDDLTLNQYLFDMGVAAPQTGISFLNLTAGRIRVVVHAGGSGAFANYDTTSDGEHYWEGGYDGANITLQKDGVEVASQAKTGTMTNACDDVAVGRHLGAGQYAKSNLRTAALITGPTTAAQDAERLKWGLSQV